MPSQPPVRVERMTLKKFVTLLCVLVSHGTLFFVQKLRFVVKKIKMNENSFVFFKPQLCENARIN